MKLRYMLVLFIVSLVPSLAVAETPEEKGKAIAEESDRRDLGWKDNKSVLKMILRNRHGQVSSAKFSHYRARFSLAGVNNDVLCPSRNSQLSNNKSVLLPV